MKKILVLIFVICCMTLTSTAQSVVGKWKCPAEFLDSLRLLSHTPNVYKNEVPPWRTGLSDEKCGGIYQCADKGYSQKADGTVWLN